MKYKVEICYSPILFDLFKNPEAIVIVTDIFRATSSICNAFTNNVKSIIPVKSTKEARIAKEQGYLVAAEKNGIKLDFADFGNSPEKFRKDIISGKDIVYSTTNGTKTIQLGSECKAVAIGAFANFSILKKWIIAQQTDVILLCAGWKGKYNVEDSIFCGAMADELLKTGNYESICDSVVAARDMWNTHKNNLRNFIENCAQRERLRKNGVDDCIDFCLTMDTCNVVPIYEDGEIIKADFKA